MSVFDLLKTQQRISEITREFELLVEEKNTLFKEGKSTNHLEVKISELNEEYNKLNENIRLKGKLFSEEPTREDVEDYTSDFPMPQDWDTVTDFH
ncbi:MAG TPA: hypothetical protein PKD00_00615 [Burkholderiales bacterium]|nr:hypothetical protein [Burkholderiales bacterium]